VIEHGKIQRWFCTGFSLVELILVLACAGILLSAAVPNLSRLQQQWTLWGSVRILETSLQWGRMKAIASNSPVIFEVDSLKQEFYWRDAVSGDSFTASVRCFPRGVRFMVTPRRALRFYQHGNAVPAGTFTIESAAGSYSVIVSPGGRIRTQKNG
jgi:prepilin-type N-terminal cleavage/methylation domain-containing protein